MHYSDFSMASKLLFIAACTLVFISSDSIAAQWGKSGSNKWLIPLFLLSPIGYLMFGILNKKYTLAQTSIAVNMGMLVGTLLVGFFIFKEPVSPKIFAAFFAAIIAILLAN